MEKWTIGEFEADWAGHPPKPPTLDDIPIQDQPLRISPQLAPGALTEGMAVPWRADFRDCDDAGLTDWWPGQRPVEVFRGQRQVDWVPSGWEYSDMVEKWSRLGFVVKEEGTDRYVEDERSPTLDNEG